MSYKKDFCGCLVIGFILYIVGNDICYCLNILFMSVFSINGKLIFYIFFFIGI